MTEEVKKKREGIINNNSLLQFTDETLVIGECIMIMTEEQRKCSKIIKSSSIHTSPRVANSLYECIRVTIYLAKEVFNKDITEEEAKEIFNNAWELNTNLCEDNYDNFWNDICNEIKKLNK
ncbi:hypothetical protein EPJ69_03620 [Brachyspira aalborgi]|uniref:Uncharacterized protein n=1 Tax=Brachyspira aalborgi TaxID=29522 RepID=A0A5C8EAA7_9SPIR|nr:hypothetical protein [Brachyspira aalborgi]TXJ33861.1 hypothetical protein EPJ69_03620 [Brachyspira aalborgi]